MTTTPPTSGRLLCVDALRGFDMFWILGADAVVKAAAHLLHLPWLELLVEHKVWAGLSPYDLIFPLFLFIAGVSLAFSLPRRIAEQGRGAALRHLAWRCVVLAALGVLYNGGLAESWPHVRIAGVLQRIAIALFVTGILIAWCRPRHLVAAAVILLAGYWAVLALVPIRDVTLTKQAVADKFHRADVTDAEVRAWYDATPATLHGGYERGRNVANHLDFVWLPGAKYQKYWDPEGILSTFPAIVTCILGVLAGQRLRRNDRSPAQHVRWFAGVGVASLAGGWLWHLQFPVIKDLWTSSFVLVAGGWGLLLLGTFYYVIEIRGWRRWCPMFVWIGMNPITLYLASSLVNFFDLAQRLAGGSVAAAANAIASGLGELLVASVALGLMVMLARFLHQRGIFIRI